MYGMASLFAEYEREAIRARVRAGMARAKKEGKIIGGGKKGRKSKRVAERANRIQVLYEKGTPIAEIARLVEVSRPTVYRVLKSS